MLPECAGVRPAPYFARAKWVQVAFESELDDEALRAYLIEAHRLAFLTLPKTLQTRLNGLLPA